MNEQILQPIAEAVAKAQPEFAGRSFYPPWFWWTIRENISVIGIDGRKVVMPLVEAKKLLPPAAKPVKEMPASPAHSPVSSKTRKE